MIELYNRGIFNFLKESTKLLSKWFHGSKNENQNKHTKNPHLICHFRGKGTFNNE